MGKKPVDNAADEAQIKKAQQKAKLERAQELDALLMFLKEPAGRRYLWKLMGKCHVFSSSFTGNNTTFFNEGMRVIGTTIMKDITEASEDAFLDMMKENREQPKEVKEKNDG